MLILLTFIFTAHTYIHACLHAHIHAQICTYICIFVHTYIQNHKNYLAFSEMKSKKTFCGAVLIASNFTNN